MPFFVVGFFVGKGMVLLNCYMRSSMVLCDCEVASGECCV